MAQFFHQGKPVAAPVLPAPPKPAPKPHVGPVLNQYYPHRVTAGLPVVLFGSVGNHNSLNVVVANVAQALHELGVNVRIRHYQNAPVDDRRAWLMSRHLIHGEPREPYAAIAVDRLDPKLDRSLVAWRGIIDSNDSFLTLFPHILDRWNSHDTVLTYSQHSARVMRETGCDDVTIMPLGVDARVFRPAVVPRHFPLPPGVKGIFQNLKGATTGNRFVFMVAGMMQPRKGLAATIEAYREAFMGRTDVLLWVHGRVKDWGWNYSGLMRDSDPPMLWTDGAVSDEVLNGMLNRADCYVSSHKLEGFGLVPLQAMSAGTPSILSDYGGPQDYATAATSWLIPCREVPAEAPGIPSGVIWAEVDQAALVRAMIEAVEDKDLRASKAAEGLKVAAQWSWARAAEAIVAKIEADGHLVSRRLSPVWDGVVDVLIPVRNAAKDIDRMLNSLFEVDAGAPFTVTVCDDASTDGTWEVLQRWAAGVGAVNGLKLLRNDVALGCPATRNRLFAAGDSEFCLLADCDLEFKQPEWLGDLLKAHLKEGAAITAPMLVYPNGKIQSAGGERDLRGTPCQHRFHGHAADLPAANVPVDVLYAPGAALLVRRSIVEKIGGMWEDYRPTYFDDVDWQMLARLHGLRTHFHPAVKVVHHDGSFKRQASPMEVMNAFVDNQVKFTATWEGLI